MQPGTSNPMMNDPFYLFFGIFGLVIGASIVWFLLAEHPFETSEVRGGPVDDLEIPLLVKLMADEGRPVDEETVARLLEFHDSYFDGKIQDSVAAAEWARAQAERERLIQGMASRDVV
jgi:hypothetical protein